MCVCACVFKPWNCSKESAEQGLLRNYLGHFCLWSSVSLHRASEVQLHGGIKEHVCVSKIESLGVLSQCSVDNKHGYTSCLIKLVNIQVWELLLEAGTSAFTVRIPPEPWRFFLSGGKWAVRGRVVGWGKWAVGVRQHGGGFFLRQETKQPLDA